MRFFTTVLHEGSSRAFPRGFSTRVPTGVLHAGATGVLDDGATAVLHARPAAVLQNDVTTFFAGLRGSGRRSDAAAGTDVKNP
jgi:hypothetical protein